MSFPVQHLNIGHSSLNALQPGLHSSASLSTSANEGHDQQEQERNEWLQTTGMAYQKDCENFPNCHDDEPRIPNTSAIVTFPFSGSYNVVSFQQRHVNLGVAYLAKKSQFGSTEFTIWIRYPLDRYRFGCISSSKVSGRIVFKA